MYLKDLYGVIISIILLHVKIFKKDTKKKGRNCQISYTSGFQFKKFLRELYALTLYFNF